MLCASNQGVGQRLSVQVAPSSFIDYVAVYNRRDASGTFAALLGTFSVYLGTSLGDTSVLCGTDSYRYPSNLDVDPYVIGCGGSTGWLFKLS